MAGTVDSGKRQYKAERCSLSRLTANLYRAAHQLYQLLGNRGAKSCATKAS